MYWCTGCGVPLARSDDPWMTKANGGPSFYDPDVVDYDNAGTWCEDLEGPHEAALLIKEAPGP